MRRLTLRRFALAVAVPVALGSLAACGNDDSTQAADPEAGQVSTGTPTASAKADPGPRRVDRATFVDRLRKAARTITTARFEMTMEIGGQAIYADGALDLTGDHPAMRFSMDPTGMGTLIDMRIVDDAIYVQDPTGGSGKYVKMDLGDPNGPLGDLGGVFDSYNPDRMVTQMSPGTFRKVTDLGSQTVDGRRLEHYRVVIDTKAASRMLQNLPSTASMPRTMSYDIWLDGQDRMAKFTMLMKKVSKVTATYSDYGAKVHITAPPASQVTDYAGMTTG
ncbi:MAG TPA: hypothetical protein VFM08_14545 [Nocardioides sp.]|jgi:hypothetical protein|nr:hypothetical protein [Nocardioides sp.]